MRETACRLLSFRTFERMVLEGVHLRVLYQDKPCADVTLQIRSGALEVQTAGRLGDL